jgi:MFS superfamily sulfate permease-like transporter
LATYSPAWLRRDLVAGVVLATLVSDLPLLFAGALGIALVALTDTISTASSFAARTGQEIDEPITDVDTTAADMLADLDEELNADGISLVFAELKDPGAREARAL